MKSIKKLCLLALVGLMAGSCEKSNPTPQIDCIEGVVISQGRTAPGEWNPCPAVVQITNRNIGKSWLNNDGVQVPNCVFIIDMPVSDIQKKGTKLYFTAYTLMPDMPRNGNCPFPRFDIVVENLSTKCVPKSK